MNRKTRIAATLLGGFALGVLGVLGWSMLVAEVIDLADRMRRARCTWVDPLEVTVADHRFALAAGPGTTVYTGADWLSGEEVSGYRDATRTYGFCLDAAPAGPVAARAVSLSFDSARALAERAGLPAPGGPRIEIAVAEMFLPAAPAPLDGADCLVVYDRDPELGWPRLVSEGIGPDGLRTGAICRDARGGDWLCDLSALDTAAGLAYRFEGLPVPGDALATGALVAPLARTAEGLRRMAALLEDAALARK
ncbi:MAG: hypothetical protein KDK10_14635 [Maritimibacter sp.]|nr:hypothetical protein [Maritimibacter sp.]